MREQFFSRIGVYGQMHYQYLKETKPSVVNVMRMKGTLRSYLEEVNTNAEEMLARLETEMAKKEGVTESLKWQDQMAWIARTRSRDGDRSTRGVVRMTTLENLWYGNIRPIENCVDGNMEYRSLLRIVTKNRGKFEETLAPEQTELFEKYYTAANEMNAASIVAAFR